MQLFEVGQKHFGMNNDDKITCQVVIEQLTRAKRSQGRKMITYNIIIDMLEGTETNLEEQKTSTQQLVL